MRFGHSRDALGLYQVIADLRRICRWIRDKYLHWFCEHALGVVAVVGIDAAGTSNQDGGAVRGGGDDDAVSCRGLEEATLGGADSPTLEGGTPTLIAIYDGG